jgi:hypothetical protein
MGNKEINVSMLGWIGICCGTAVFTITQDKICTTAFNGRNDLRKTYRRLVQNKVDTTTAEVLEAKKKALIRAQEMVLEAKRKLLRTKRKLLRTKRKLLRTKRKLSRTKRKFLEAELKIMKPT